MRFQALMVRRIEPAHVEPVAKIFAEHDATGMPVRLSVYPVGTRVVLRNFDRTRPEITELMCFDLVRRETQTATVPDRLGTDLELPGPAQAAGVRRFDFTRRPDGMWGINALPQPRRP